MQVTLPLEHRLWKENKFITQLNLNYHGPHFPTKDVPSVYSELLIMHFLLFAMFKVM